MRPSRIPPAQPAAFPWKSFLKVLSVVSAVLLLVLIGSFSVGPSLFQRAAGRAQVARVEPDSKDVLVSKPRTTRPPELLMTIIGEPAAKQDVHGTRFVLVSDLHGAHTYADLVVPDGEVLVIAGDAGIDDDEEAKVFDDWLGALPHAHKVVVYGNMDRWGPDPNGCKRLKNARVLCDEVAEVAGFKIFGSPWTPPFFGAFNFKDQQHAVEHWGRLLPPDAQVDIIVTHGPPFGVADTARGRHVGDKALRDAVMALEKPPQLWACGHIHEGYGAHKFPHPKGEFVIVNSAMAYLTKGQMEAAPRTVELPGGHVTLSQQPQIQRRLQMAKEAKPWKPSMGYIPL